VGGVLLALKCARRDFSIRRDSGTQGCGCVRENGLGGGRPLVGKVHQAR
jgi:hypothetical protein